MTSSRRLLIAVLQRTTQAEIAARLRVTKQAVSMWVTGIERPSKVHRDMLWILYRIPRQRWGASAGARASETT